MLEKNKKCIEFSMRSMMLSRRPYQEDVNIEITGMISGREIFAENPFDIPIDVVVIPKKEVERLQEYNQRYRELAKQWEENYNLLLKKTGFDTVEELVNYIHDNGPNSQMNWETLKEIINDAEEDYISERDKAEELQKENEQLKKKLEGFSPVSGYSEFLKALYPEATEETIEKLVWTTNQILDCPVSANGWEESAKFWKKRYDDLFKLVGFSSAAEMGDYLTNEAECDTLHEAILKLIDENKYAYEEWCKANSSNNSWKAAAECNSPKELMKKIEGFEKEIGIYSRALQEWKEVTGYPSPSAAKTAIEAGASWCHTYNDVKKANEELGELIMSWQKATSCETPEKAKELISSKNAGIVELKNKLDASLTEYEVLLKLTGYKSEDAIRVMLNDSEQFVYENMRELINSLKRKLKFTESNWQTATGCKTPDEAKSAIRYYKSRLGNAIQAAGCAVKHLETIGYVDPIKED